MRSSKKEEELAKKLVIDVLPAYRTIAAEIGLRWDAMHEVALEHGFGGVFMRRLRDTYVCLEVD